MQICLLAEIDLSAIVLECAIPDMIFGASIGLAACGIGPAGLLGGWYGAAAC